MIDTLLIWNFLDTRSAAKLADTEPDSSTFDHIIFPKISLESLTNLNGHITLYKDDFKSQCIKTIFKLMDTNESNNVINENSLPNTEVLETNKNINKDFVI